MSYAHAYTTYTGVAGNGNWGPGLNGYAKDRLGWMPKSSIYRFGAAGEKKATLSLAVSCRHAELLYGLTELLGRMLTLGWDCCRLWQCFKCLQLGFLP